MSVPRKYFNKKCRFPTPNAQTGLIKVGWYCLFAIISAKEISEVMQALAIKKPPKSRTLGAQCTEQNEKIISRASRLFRSQYN